MITTRSSPARERFQILQACASVTGMERVRRCLQALVSIFKKSRVSATSCGIVTRASATGTLERRRSWLTSWLASNSKPTCRVETKSAVAKRDAATQRTVVIRANCWRIRAKHVYDHDGAASKGWTLRRSHSACAARASLQILHDTLLDGVVPCPSASRISSRGSELPLRRRQLGRALPRIGADAAVLPCLLVPFVELVAKGDACLEKTPLLEPLLFIQVNHFENVACLVDRTSLVRCELLLNLLQLPPSSGRRRSPPPRQPYTTPPPRAVPLLVEGTSQYHRRGAAIV